MRIAFFTDTYRPQVNGVVTSIDNFAAELRRLGHNVEIFSPSSDGYPGFPSIPFVPYPEYRIGFPSINQISRFRRKKFDIVHIHTPISIGAIGLGMAKHLKIPAVFTLHTLLPEYLHYVQLSGLYKLLRIGVMNRLAFLETSAKNLVWQYCVRFCNSTNAVIAPSDEITAILKERGVIKPVYTVPTGVSAFNTIKKKSLPKTPTILHVGRITKEKRINVIVDALSKLPQNVRLIIASDGPYRIDLERYVKARGLEERVCFTGYVSHTRLESLYRHAGVFAIASKTETQAIVLAEAAATGLPIVAVDSPVTGNFVRKNRLGYVAQEKDFPDALLKAFKIKKHIEFPKEYSSERCTRRLLAVYNSLHNSQ
jgi:glycosyltransferase involved in cell wall biosynthesis